LEAEPWATSLMTLVVVKFIPVPVAIPQPKVAQLPLKCILIEDELARIKVMFKNQFRAVGLALLIVM
jgi:hypothetical protein